MGVLVFTIVKFEVTSSETSCCLNRNFVTPLHVSVKFCPFCNVISLTHGVISGPLFFRTPETIIIFLLNVLVAFSFSVKHRTY